MGVEDGMNPLAEMGQNLLNGVQNYVGEFVGDFVRSKLGKDNYEKTITEVKKVLPSLHNFKVVS